jgi:hypothetical protein
MRFLAFLFAAVAAALVISLQASSSTSIEQQIRVAFPDDPTAAVCIASSESTGTHRPPWRFNAAALNGPHVGLFQISFTWHARRGESFASFRERVSRPAENIALARRIYLDARRRFGRGWLPWTTRSLCGR